jgi:hypothetical protein
MANTRRETTYARWLQQEGLPVARGYSVTDVRTLELAPWPRRGGRGAYIQLDGMEGLTGMYVGEIPPGGALEPEKHLYDELICILSGRGITAVWGTHARPTNGAAADPQTIFEWQTGSLFAPPLNTWYRLSNASGTEPARFLAVTTAPVVMDLFHNVDFVFNSDYVFDDRYDGAPDYFARAEDPRPVGDGWLWETNFIPNALTAELKPQEAKGAGSTATRYQMSGNVLVGHMAEFPVGRYMKAHYHGGGAIIFIARSHGYSLLWRRELGTRPYESGQGDQVIRVPWQEGSVFSPPSDWFHQHFNLGAQPARQVALRYGSHRYGVQFYDVHHPGKTTHASLREGGTTIASEDEDPEIRRQYQQALAEVGVDYRMPNAVSR